jgi:GntR family transcriptional regulator
VTLAPRQRATRGEVPRGMHAWDADIARERDELRGRAERAEQQLAEALAELARLRRDTGTRATEGLKWPVSVGQAEHMTRRRDAGLADRIRRIWLDAARNGAAFPGEPALARELQASRPAVREALVRLEAEGLINKRQGAETAVNRAAVEIAARLDQQVDNEEIIEAMGRKASMDILEADVIALNEDDSIALDLTEGSKALRVAKRWRADGVPVLVAINLIPLLHGDKPADADVGQSLFRLVQRLGHQKVEWELAWPSATNLEPPISDWLEQPPGRAALTLEMVGVSRAGNRAYLATEFHVPTAFRYGLIRSVR